MSSRVNDIIIRQLQQSGVPAGPSLYAISAHVLNDTLDLVRKAKPKALARDAEIMRSIEDFLNIQSAQTHFVIPAHIFSKLLDIFRSPESYRALPLLVRDALRLIMDEHETLESLKRKDLKNIFRQCEPELLSSTMDVIREVEGGNALIDALEKNDVSIETYYIPDVLWPYIHAAGDYMPKLRLMRLFVNEADGLNADPRPLWAEIIAHEMRHDWQFQNPIIQDAQAKLQRKTPVADLFYHKVIEADALRFGSMFGHRASRSPLIRRRQLIGDKVPVFRQAERAFKDVDDPQKSSRVAAFTFAAALSRQHHYHEQPLNRRIRQSRRFPHEWTALIDQIENRDTPLGRLGWHVMSTVCRDTRNECYLTGHSGLTARALANLRMVPPAPRALDKK